MQKYARTIMKFRRDCLSVGKEVEASFCFLKNIRVRVDKLREGNAFEERKQAIIAF